MPRCRQCDRPHTRQVRHDYCSGTCAALAELEHLPPDAEELPPSRFGRRCERCGRMIDAAKKLNTRFCSDACRNRSWLDAHRAPA